METPLVEPPSDPATFSPALFVAHLIRCKGRSTVVNPLTALVCTLTSNMLDRITRVCLMAVLRDTMRMAITDRIRRTVQALVPFNGRPDKLLPPYHLERATLRPIIPNIPLRRQV